LDLLIYRGCSFANFSRSGYGLLIGKTRAVITFTFPAGAFLIFEKKLFKSKIQLAKGHKKKTSTALNW
jgi:hypothetical protein